MFHCRVPSSAGTGFQSPTGLASMGARVIKIEDADGVHHSRFEEIVVVAEALLKQFCEVIFAPRFTEGALEMLSAKQNMRVLEDNERRRENIGERDLKREAENVFKTTDEEHPGVAMTYREGARTIAGPISVEKLPEHIDAVKPYLLTPAETKKTFEERGWKTVVAFQTLGVGTDMTAVGGDFAPIGGGRLCCRVAFVEALPISAVSNSMPSGIEI